ncbi:MAG: hybrid sensor histidine kinase/response regulator [Synechococcales cyanobacterium CRU_2_2]|nr:hybrid sensor histidine kinase/response regulator [Synechococcales cyanobacterium CRU_2_2]
MEDLFEQLPAEAIGARGAIAEPDSSPAAAPATSQTHPPAKTASKESSHTAALSGISVRVDLSVLERMNNLVGELVLNRNSLSLQHDQLQMVVGQMSKRFKSFGDLVNGLREASDQMLLQSNPSEGTTRHLLPSSQNQGEENLTAGFDSLEMDRYNGLHTQIQDIFEELMQLEEGVDDIDVLLEQTTQSISQQRQGLSRLQNELMWARMLPLDNILSRFPRVLRDLSAKHGKLVELNLVGTGVLVDKGILEKLHDPMLHLLRNAFDHGIEPPETRRQQGKPEQGTIEIRAFHQGNQTVIEIKDDGRGLNLEKIARRAVELGWVKREELRTIPQQVVADLIFEPNFSTALEVSELSGRGVGLNVVREQLKALKGTVSATSSPGEGTKFSLKLPLTLSVAKLMVCQVGPLAIALPSDAIEDLLVPEPKRIKLVAQQRFLHWRDDLIAIHPMAELLDYNCPLPDATSLKTLTDSTIPIPPDWAPPVLILKQGEQHFALEVNRLLMEQELVIKPFGNAATAPEYAYGCTILGDGQMIPVLDASALLGSLTQATSSFSGTGIHLGEETSIVTLEAPVAPPSMSSVAPARLSKTILVVDDSTAMRRTLALSLEKAGYRILQAGDGQEALEQLRQSSTIQLVICDVEMPTMNGFEFLSQRRREPELLKVPVVMLTSRSSDKHRRLALQLNANDYFSKPYVEQEFLKSIRAILDEAPTPSISPV